MKVWHWQVCFKAFSKRRSCIFGIMSLFPTWSYKSIHLVYGPDLNSWIIDTQEILDCNEKSLSTNIHQRPWWRQSVPVYPLSTLGRWAVRWQAQWFKDEERGILLVCKRELIQRSWFLINSGVIYNRSRLRADSSVTPSSHTHLLLNTNTQAWLAV